MRKSRVGSLATAETGTNHPYASLITVATETDGSPIFLISRLAWHTRNLESDPRASILLAAEAGPGDPLNLGRVSLMGAAEPTADPGVRQRFLARHPDAALYVDFADFSFWRLQVERAHFVGGFGRIATLSAADILLDPIAAQAWNAAVDDVIHNINDREAELIGRLSVFLGAGTAEGWRLGACDPDGCDLMSGDRSVRLSFPGRLGAPEEVAGTLGRMAESGADRNVN